MKESSLPAKEASPKVGGDKKGWEDDEVSRTSLQSCV